MGRLDDPESTTYHYVVRSSDRVVAFSQHGVVLDNFAWGLNDLPVRRGVDDMCCDILVVVGQKPEEGAAVVEDFILDLVDVDDVVFFTCEPVDVALDNLKSDFGIVFSVLHDNTEASLN